MTDSRAHADEKLDETLEETFPASDAPANTVETGIVIGEVPSAAGGSGDRGGIDAVVDNTAEDRFELAVDGDMAFLVYKRTPEALALIHTEVPAVARGRGLGEALVEAALESARSAGLRIIPICPFAKAYIRRHAAHREAGG